MRVDEVPHDLVQHRRPDGADGVHLVERVGGRVGVGVARQAGGVRVRAQALGVVEDPGADAVVGVAGVGGLGADGRRHEVAPALAHAAGFEDVEAGRVGGAAGQPVGQAVRVFVDDDAGLEGAVAHGVGVVPDVHPHARHLAVGGRGEVGVVQTAAVLRVEDDVVAADAAAVAVVDFEVTGRFGEAEVPEEVVVVVGGVEELGYGSRSVGCEVGRVEVEWVFKVFSFAGGPEFV